MRLISALLTKFRSVLELEIESNRGHPMAPGSRGVFAFSYQAGHTETRVSSGAFIAVATAYC